MLFSWTTIRPGAQAAQVPLPARIGLPQNRSGALPAAACRPLTGRTAPEREAGDVRRQPEPHAKHLPQRDPETAADIFGDRNKQGGGDTTPNA